MLKNLMKKILDKRRPELVSGPQGRGINTPHPNPLPQEAREKCLILSLIDYFKIKHQSILKPHHFSDIRETNFLSSRKISSHSGGADKNVVSFHKSLNFKPFNFSSCSLGFTLAEVLITLGIIGVVAAMTIPALMQKTNDKDTVVALKKAYSTLYNAYTLAMQENSTPDNWGNSVTFDKTSTENMINYLSSLKIIKNCGTKISGCGPNVSYRYLNGSKWTNWSQDTNFAKAILSDGSILYAVYWAGLQSSGIIGNYYIDINGNKQPNQLGVDTFSFNLTKSGISPTSWYYFSSDCQNKNTGNGTGCTAWVLYKENMDYLHCNDLSWDGKTKCD